MAVALCPAVPDVGHIYSDPARAAQGGSLSREAAPSAPCGFTMKRPLYAAVRRVNLALEALFHSWKAWVWRISGVAACGQCAAAGLSLAHFLGKATMSAMASVHHRCS